MIRARVAEFVHRRRLFVIGSVVAAVAVLVCIPVLGWLAAVNLGALAVVVGLVHASTYDTGENGVDR